jgi:lipopolysaccharide transport system ATP-binding protein
VLAVGDAEFQKKCLGKIKEVSNDRGRTVLLVSHNLNHISTLCNKAILLNEGKLVGSGNAEEVISSYVTAIEQRSSNCIWPVDKRPGNDIVRLHAVRVMDIEHQTRLNFKSTEKIGIEMTYEVLRENNVLWLGHSFADKLSVNIFDTHNVNTEYYYKPHTTGIHTSTVWIPANLLNAGTYYVGSAIFNHLQNVIHLEEDDSVLFKVHDPVDEMTAKGMSPGNFPGVVRPLLEWSIEKT